MKSFWSVLVTSNRCLTWLIFFFFFFQAEDGIRDLTVTGVQTCALPICKLRASLEALREPRSGKALKGQLGGLWSLRIGKFRLIYRIAPSRRLELVALDRKSVV